MEEKFLVIDIETTTYVLSIGKITEIGITEVDPENGAYMDSLGWVYFKKGMFEEALKQLETASQLIEDPVVFEHLGETYIKLGKQEEAAQAWKKALEIDPENEEVKKKIETLGQ